MFAATIVSRVPHQPAMTVEPTTGSAVPPIWKESFWPVDWMALRMSPVYYGFGVPRGDGSPVVVVPGFMGNDLYLSELYMWLGRIGYRPYMSGIGLNAECPGRLSRRLVKTVERAHRETGKRVRVVGHSLGGVLARRVCLTRPAIVSQLVYMGSPVQAVHAHPAVILTAAVMQAAREVLSGKREDCLTENCGCGFSHEIARPLPRGVRHSAIYTRADGVVDWHDAQESNPRRNHEVGGTHIGLVFNPRAYRALGQVLARPE